MSHRRAFMISVLCVAAVFAYAWHTARAPGAGLVVLEDPNGTAALLAAVDARIAASEQRTWQRVTRGRDEAVALMQAWVRSEVAAGTVEVYRFWSPVYACHFYTADPNERDAVLATWPDVWSYEGVAFRVVPPPAELK
jgi:hypothetical protein